ncbi:MAG: acyl-[acyl-carrier-protein]--UDP-N-acetylglucosamine O-acyltransferase, partial [Pararhodobacter sp.]|nr:acyl-[acyl-carrier-protein]--UDP-N-acetylglucosamine O-acyltransferase [Pararhodobacter sp.]
MAIHASAQVHPSALVDAGATIGPACQIGPFCVIGPEVTLGAGVVLKSHGLVTGWTEVGDDSVLYPFATVGEVPQDL